MPEQPRVGRAELLARVVRRGELLRRRRRIVVGTVLVGLIAVGTSLPFALADRSGGRRVVVRPSPAGPAEDTTTPVPTTMTIPPETTMPATTVASGTTSPTTMVRRPPPTSPPITSPATTTPPVVCTWADRSACGPNAPLTVSVVAYPAAPQLGQLVTFTVTATDPDAVIDSNACGSSHVFGDETVHTRCAASCLEPAPSTAYSPMPGHITMQFAHVYLKAGTYTALFDFISGAVCSGNPYGSTGEAKLVVTVT